MAATVGLQMGKPQPTMLVPEAAVRKDENGLFVLIINEDNAVQRRPVQVRERYEKMFVVQNMLEQFPGGRDGLYPDDWVVIDGAADLHVGDRVEPRRVK